MKKQKYNITKIRLSTKSVLAKDKKVVEILNFYFKTAINSLDISGNIFPMNSSGDSIQMSIKKYRMHPSILRVKQSASFNNFTFKKVIVSQVTS